MKLLPFLVDVKKTFSFFAHFLTHIVFSELGKESSAVMTNFNSKQVDEAIQALIAQQP